MSGQVMSATLLRLERQLVKLEELIIFAALMGLVVNLFLQVLFRFVLKVPLDFTEEISRILLVWLVFIGAARGVYVGQHFMVGLVFNKLPESLQRPIGLLVDMVTVGLLAVLMWGSWHAAQSGALQMLPVLGVSVQVQTLAMPVGMALMALHTAILLVRRWCEGNPSLALDGEASS